MCCRRRRIKVVTVLGGIFTQRSSLVRELAYSAILIALFTVLRIALYPLIGGNPTFVLIILISAFLSPRVAYLSGIGFYILTGILLGFGIWVLFQLIAISLIVFVASRLPKQRMYFYVFGVLSSFIYSFIMLFSALPYVALEAMPAYIMAGLPHDFARAATNAVYMVILYRESFLSILTKYNAAT